VLAAHVDHDLIDDADGEGEHSTVGAGAAGNGDARSRSLPRAFLALVASADPRGFG